MAAILYWSQCGLKGTPLYKKLYIATIWLVLLAICCAWQKAVKKNIYDYIYMICISTAQVDTGAGGCIVHI